MNFYFIKTPKIIRQFYKNYLWKVNTNKKEIFLTFDDGPTPEVTNLVLDVLKEHYAKATFFCIGKNIKANPKLFKRIISEGHAVGNHTYNHLNGWKTNVDTYIKDVEKAENVINNFQSQTSKSQKLFRPPYGKIKSSQANKLIDLGYKVIMWSVLSGDFDTVIDTEKCLSNILNNTKSGSIIVFHDSEKAFGKLENVLPKMITHFLKLGYKFKSL